MSILTAFCVPPPEAEEKAVEQAHDTDFAGCVIEYDFEIGTATEVKE